MTAAIWHCGIHSHNYKQSCISSTLLDKGNVFLHMCLCVCLFIMKVNDSSDAENVQTVPPHHGGYMPCKETLTTLTENSDCTTSVQRNVPCAIYSWACSETGDALVFYIKSICILNIKIICNVY